ncbi:MAG: hypothetical protein V3S54_08725 [Woeseiaceae bacterium]
MASSGCPSRRRSRPRPAGCARPSAKALARRITWPRGETLYYERIICAEETFVQRKFGKTYTDWGARTPVFIPKPWRRSRPELPFSLRTVLRREYNGLFFIVVAFTLIEPIDDVLSQGD